MTSTSFSILPVVSGNHFTEGVTWRKTSFPPPSAHLPGGRGFRGFKKMLFKIVLDGRGVHGPEARLVTRAGHLRRRHELHAELRPLGRGPIQSLRRPVSTDRR